MKLGLCLLIVVLSAYIGRLLSKKVLQRLTFFREYQAAIIYLTDRMVGLSLELYKALDAPADNDILAFFTQCSKSLKNSPQSRFSYIWEYNFSKNDARHSFLTKEDKKMIFDGGEAIETLCKNPSEKQANVYIKRLTGFVNEMEIDKRKRCKLYNTAGVLAGLFIALMVI